MTQIEWTEEFSVGHAEIDREHEALIAQVNHIHNQLKLPMDSTAVESCLADLQDDISAHFALEELLMLEAGYGEYAAHKQDHDQLLDEIQDMIFHFSEDSHNGKKLLMDRLSDWFSRHFKDFDARLHDQLG